MFRIITVIAAAGLLLGAGGVSAQTVTLKIGSHDPPVVPLVSKGFQGWAKAVEKDSQGTIKFKHFWGGQLARSPAKQHELLKNGILDVTNIVPIYTLNLFPDFDLFGLPFLFNSSEEASLTAWGLYEKGLLRGLENIYVAAFASTDNQGIHLTKKVKTVADLKGMKIRVSGAAGAAVVKLIGAAPVGMPITQVGISLSSGVVQGAMTGWAPLDFFGITPSIKTHLDLPYGVTILMLSVSRKVYDGLPAAGKKAMDKNRGGAWTEKFGKIGDFLGNMARGKAVKDPKRTVIRFTGAELKAQEKTFEPLHDAWIAKTPDGAKKYKALKEILSAMRKN